MIEGTKGPDVVMKTPHISVIIPTHNREKFIGAAIQSVFNQTWQDLEIIVVDDGSVDNTKDLIQAYHSEKITYVHLKQGGPGWARNNGISRAKGDMVAFLDSDDIWEPNKLELQMEVMAGDPQVKMALANFKFIDPVDNILNESGVDPDYSYDGQFLRDYLDGRLPVYTSTVMVKRDVFDKVGSFDEQHMIAEDLDLWIKIAAHFKVGYVHKPLTHIRKHSGNISGASRKKTYFAATVMIERNRENIRTAGLSPEKYLARFYNLAGNEARKEKDRKDAISYFKKAISAYPSDIAGYSGILKTLLIPKT